MGKIGRTPIVLVVIALAAAVTATAGAKTSAITPPAAIKSAGKIVFCSDVTYPPEEYFKGSKAIGSDIDIASGVAKLMGVTAQIKNTTFDSIIPALLAKKCDAVISGMNDTAARRKQVDFVDYLKVGQAVTVKKGNPEHFSTLASLSGKRVSVESGTTNRDFLAATSKQLTKHGRSRSPSSPSRRTRTHSPRCSRAGWTPTTPMPLLPPTTRS